MLLQISKIVRIFNKIIINFLNFIWCQMVQIRNLNSITTLDFMTFVETFDKKLNWISSYLTIVLTRWEIIGVLFPYLCW